MDKLPPELVINILEHLDQADLRSAAAVSRSFYAAAWRAGLYIHRNISWSDQPAGVSPSTTPTELVHHALKKGLRLSVSSHIMLFNTDSVEQPNTSSIVQVLLSFITAALPVLVYLEVACFPGLIPHLAAALRHPAPNLAILDLTVPPFHAAFRSQELPADLFVECVPKLRRLSLHGIALGRYGIAAFAHLQCICLGYRGNFPEITFARQFPCMRDLQLWLTLENNESSPPPFNFEGVSLRKLTFRVHNSSRAGPVVLTGTDMSCLPDVEHFGSAVAWSDPLWHRTDDGPICIRIIWRSFRDISVLIVPEHVRWRRVYHRNDWSSGSDEFPVSRLPGLQARLTYLRMDNNFLPSLLGSAGLALAALRKMQIDFRAQARLAQMVWPPDWLRDPDLTSYSCVECSALERLTLFAMDAQMSVESREVASLGRALSQCARRVQDRATLELVGVELEAPIALSLLDQTFSEVHRHEFVGENSVPGRDNGLWDREPRP
ncbi:hypothetical protein AURDEDRAFT_185058 [Auricularia subglabra TFB-10046 SS5]|nr:hypothetical protein AURDEDRAFT_185058 [Auricularia subglabra TFB-10046 SS5]